MCVVFCFYKGTNHYDFLENNFRILILHDLVFVTFMSHL